MTNSELNIDEDVKSKVIVRSRDSTPCYVLPLDYDSYNFKFLLPVRSVKYSSII